MTRLEEIKSLLGMKETEDVAIVEITPEVAEKLLMYNTHNRPRQERRIKEYIADMKNGRWCLSESAIGFDKDGVLTNGQTRLEACVTSGSTFSSIVCTVLEQNIHMDTGNTRKVIDNIILNGDADDYINVNHNSLKVICELIRFNNGIRRVTPEPVIDFCKKYGKYIDKAFEAGLFTLSNTSYGLSRAQIAAAFLAAYINGVDITTLAHIRTVLSSGIVSDKNDASIIIWRDKLLKFAGVNTNAMKKQIYLGTQSIINSISTGKNLKRVHTDCEYYHVDI
jgi:hypothetical protein